MLALRWHYTMDMFVAIVVVLAVFQQVRPESALAPGHGCTEPPETHASRDLATGLSDDERQQADADVEQMHGARGGEGLADTGKRAEGLVGRRLAALPRFINRAIRL